MSADVTIEISPHARVRMADRGASEEDVITAIRQGEPEACRKGRVMFRKNFPLNALWRGKWCAVKQVAPIVVLERGECTVVTVHVYYF